MQTTLSTVGPEIKKREVGEGEGGDERAIKMNIITIHYILYEADNT